MNVFQVLIVCCILLEASGVKDYHISVYVTLIAFSFATSILKIFRKKEEKK